MNLKQTNKKGNKNREIKILRKIIGEINKICVKRIENPKKYQKLLKNFLSLIFLTNLEINYIKI